MTNLLLWQWARTLDTSLVVFGRSTSLLWPLTQIHTHSHTPCISILYSTLDYIHISHCLFIITNTRTHLPHAIHTHTKEWGTEGLHASLIIYLIKLCTWQFSASPRYRVQHHQDGWVPDPLEYYWTRRCLTELPKQIEDTTSARHNYYPSYYLY